VRVIACETSENYHAAARVSRIAWRGVFGLRGRVGLGAVPERRAAGLCRARAARRLAVQRGDRRRLSPAQRRWTDTQQKLVAEMTAAVTCAALGIVPTVRHADDIGSWLEVLREDNRAIVRAASAASKAADFRLAFAANGER